MTFVLPEFLHSVWRWREAMFGAFMAFCGMIWAVTQQGMLATIGMSIAIVGALIIFAGIQKRRFRVTAGGPGIVQVSDGMVTYYGPYEGGSVLVDALESVALDPAAQPHAEWVLSETGSHPVRIPTNAQNAEILFNVFSKLEGIRTENMLAKLRSNPQQPVMIWTEAQRQLH